MKQLLFIFIVLFRLSAPAQDQVVKDTISLIYQLDGVTINGHTTWKKGDKIVLGNLIFKGNTSFLEVSSKPLLDELLTVMINNPKLKVEIQGHICCYPDRTHPISKERAQVVYEYLLDNGIKRSRIRYKDFGGRNPIYPIPEQTNEQRNANRRVEIEVLEN
ncbi:OmpA family protein [Flavobacterium sp. DG1-102-2]|uniref:OmpA family protein n=1 Tax=Flavobacterium sp. DG1-102-2 TaxID=3081663 RepID=UPI002949B69B|nr:OmpA family protein [Flavobacterium sp. DG1-102-2]MDV6170076.1 OmpA family protein [Flavobacterium sp. DG1-102-2]